MKRYWKFGCFFLIVEIACGSPRTAEEVMANVRRECGVVREKIPAAGILLTGKGEVAGLATDYTVVFSGDGAFAQMSSGRISVATGFDGKDAWTQDIGGERRLLELGDRNQALFGGLIMTGMWMDKGSGIAFTQNLDTASDGNQPEHTTILNFNHADLGVSGTLAIDADTWMAKEWKYRGTMSDTSVAFSGEVKLDGMKFPAKIVRTSKNGVDEELVFEKASVAPQYLVSPYAANVSGPTDVTFDSSIAAELEVRKAPTGHILVHPLINGKDFGWFIFDTGAGSNVLNNRVVKELGLETFGSLPAVGVGGAVMTSWSRPGSIALGRVTLKDPLVVGLELDFLEPHMGVPIAGIIGYGLFHRCVAEVDMRDAKISLFDPASYDESTVNGHWSKLHLDSRVACVEASFEGHTGIFKLDTGAGNSTVSMHAPAVKRLNLLDGRETTDVMEGGVGGAVSARRGKLAWFEIGGQRQEDVPATFATEDKGAYSSRETIGNIGGKLIGPFKIVFDYQRRRIGFVKR